MMRFHYFTISLFQREWTHRGEMKKCRRAEVDFLGFYFLCLIFRVLFPLFTFQGFISFVYFLGFSCEGEERCRRDDVE